MAARDGNEIALSGETANRLAKRLAPSRRSNTATTTTTDPLSPGSPSWFSITLEVTAQVDRPT